jgi:hypothetical protein
MTFFHALPLQIDYLPRKAYFLARFAQFWCENAFTFGQAAPFMAAAAHDPKFAKKAGVPMKVAKEYNRADKGPKLARAMEPMKKDDI